MFESQPELRQDPVSRRWVIYPGADIPLLERITWFSTSGDGTFGEQDNPTCRYCPGREGETPPEVLAYRKSDSSPDEPGWWIRIFEADNNFLRIEIPSERSADGIYDRMTGFGRHEVLVETPFHGLDTFRGDATQIQEALYAYQQRLSFFKTHREIKYCSFVRSFGISAGNGHQHAHGHIFATPVFSKKINKELNSAREHYAHRERCLFCDIIEQEREANLRLLHADDRFIVFSPYAARFPFELVVIPVDHNPNFDTLSPADTVTLSLVIRKVLGQICTVLASPAYMLVLHNGPNVRSRKIHDFWLTLDHDYHWYMEIIPVSTPVAGFEVGTGLYRNAVFPEEAVKLLLAGSPILPPDGSSREDSDYRWNHAEETEDGHKS